MGKLDISFNFRLLGNEKTEFEVLSDEEKIGLLKEMISDQCKKPEDRKSMLGKHISELEGNTGERLTFTLDKSGRVFRCWYGGFGGVSKVEEHYHFDSCGRGMLFHISCEIGNIDLLLFYIYRYSFVGRMVKWTSEYGTMWAGWH